jgi:hypothetical protein
MSNAERQARFRESHPGYNRKYSGHSTPAQRQRIKQEQNEQLKAIEAELAAKTQSSAAPVKSLPLMLPAPVEDSMMASLKALAASLASAPVGSVPVAQSAENSSAKSAA